MKPDPVLWVCHKEGVKETDLHLRRVPVLYPSEDAVKFVFDSLTVAGDFFGEPPGGDCTERRPGSRISGPIDAVLLCKVACERNDALLPRPLE